MVGVYDRDGLIRIAEDDTRTGAYTADGAWRVEDIATGPFVTSSGARRKDMVQDLYRTVDVGIALTFNDETLTYNGESLTYGG